MIKRNAAQQNFDLSSQKRPEFYRKSYTDWAIYIVRIFKQRQEFFSKFQFHVSLPNTLHNLPNVYPGNCH